jgi:Kdo2-lipid IVA lauroyltransferase/acyltransferase
MTQRKSLSQFRAPKHWPVWLGLGLLRLVCLLPYAMQLRIGKLLGRIAHRFAKERRAISRRNIALCFPELSPIERDALALAHFESLGMSIIELGLGRWAPDRKLLAMTRIEGAENIREATDRGVGVILLSAHFTTLEISGRVLSLNSPPFDAVYRKNRSDFMTEILRTNREKAARSTIEKNDIKSMVRSLREGTPVWYAPDQSYNRKQSALLPFFGVPSMTNTATGTLARLGKAVVVPFFPRRLPEGGYVLTLMPAIEGIPSEDPIEDTKKYLEILERQIRLCPEQYYWVHRKFKNRPEPLPDVYADLTALE